MDIHGTSVGHPTLTDQACPTVLSSPPVQWTSMGCQLDIPPSLTRLVPLSCPVHLSNGHPRDVRWTSHPHRPGLSHCPVQTTCPMDVNGTSVGRPTLTDQACPTVLSSPPVQWTSTGCQLDIPPSLTRLVPLSCPVHLCNGHPWDVRWISHPHRPGLSHCPVQSTCPMDVHGMSVGHPTLTDQACPTVLSSPPVQWTSTGRSLDIPPSQTRLVPLSCPDHLSNGCQRDVRWTSHPHRPGLSHCPVQSTCPMDVHGTSVGHPTLTDW